MIDCDDIRAGTCFWSAALGAEVEHQDERYVSLGCVVGRLRVLLQKVPEPKTAKSRMHLDIETDDVEAEMRRLEELGARRVQQTDGHTWVMQIRAATNFV